MDSKKTGKQNENSSSLNKINQIEIDSSDSEFEGFVDIKSPSLTTENGKGLSDLKTGKASFAGLKSSGKGGKGFSAGKGDGKGDGKGFNAGKGDGKGFNAGKGGSKGSLPQAKPIKTSVTDNELELELELPPGAKLAMDCEASTLLQGIQEHLDSLKDQKIKIPESFGKTLLYSKAAVHYTDVKSVKQALESLKEHGATDGEICMIANTGPETSEEAYGLIPSLKKKKLRIGGPLTTAIATLAKFKVSPELPH